MNTFLIVFERKQLDFSDIINKLKCCMVLPTVSSIQMDI